MSALLKKIKAIPKIYALAIVLIVIGLALAVRYGIRTFFAFREMRYASLNNFAAGDLDVNLIRPWMTLRYIAVAYAVPQEYLLHETGIPIKIRSSMTSLRTLNNDLNLGWEGSTPVLQTKIQQAIIEYRKNPVPTGLLERGVRDWMTVQYIANSTGISAEQIFTQIGIPADDNANKPLGFLSDEIHYPGGPDALIRAVQHVVDTSPRSTPTP